ncbi:dihydroneopterin aldolase [bacterium]|nr:dihydroneopterin aldolase [candidate division CSSED10-310 bacterium]
MHDDKIIIRDLHLRAIIGVNEWERNKKQDVILNLVLYTDMTQTGETDSIEHTVNYRTVTKEIIRLVEGSKRRTLEALAADVAGICLSVPAVKRVSVRVEKPGALRFSRSAGVEIERTKQPD